MAKTKLTKTAVDGANARGEDYELRDTTVPGFLVKVTPAGRKISCCNTAPTRASAGNCHRRYGEYHGRASPVDRPRIGSRHPHGRDPSAAKSGGAAGGRHAEL